MKKSVAACWVFAMSLVLVIFSMISDADAQLLDRSLSLMDIASSLKTPEEIARYMWRHFNFEEDQRQFGTEERWQSPEEFLMNGKGDCEDFALFANKILQLNGKSSFLLNVYSNSFSHTVCVFKENGRYNVIDGTHVTRLEATNLKDLASYVYPFWKKGAIVKPSQSYRGKIMAEFERTLKADRHFSTAS